MDWLLDRIGKRREVLLELQNSGDVQMFVCCIWWSAFGSGGPRFWPEQLRSLADLGLEFEFDFAFYGAEREA